MKRKLMLLFACAIVSMGASECGDGFGDPTSEADSWVGSAGPNSAQAMANVPGNVVGGFNVLGDVLNK